MLKTYINYHLFQVDSPFCSGTSLFQGAWTKDNQNKNLRHGPSIFCEASVLSLPFAPGSDYPLHPNTSPQQKGRGWVQEEQPGQQRIASWHYHWVLIMTSALITDARKKWGRRDIHHIWSARPTQWSELATLYKYCHCRRAKFLNVQTTSEHIWQVGLSIWMRAKLLSPLPFSAQNSGKHPAFEHPN